MDLVQLESTRERRLARELVSQTAPETPRLFTLGYEGSTIDRFVQVAVSNGIRAIIDVRFNPLSRKKGFSKTSFRETLANAGIEYFHFPELGVPSQFRRNLKSAESYRALFEYYDREILSAHPAAVDRILELLAQYSTVALTCFESDHRACHRHKITELIGREHAGEFRIEHLAI